MDKLRLYVDEEQLKQIMATLPKEVTLEMIMAQAVQNQITLNGTVALVKQHEARLTALEDNPSIASYFKRRPARTSAAVLTVFLILEIAANTVPDLLKLLLSIP